MKAVRVLGVTAAMIFVPLNIIGLVLAALIAGTVAAAFDELWLKP